MTTPTAPADPEDAAGFVYVDGETTGLDPRIHQMFELAYARDSDSVRRLILPHTLRNAEPAALEVNRYHERGIADQHVLTGQHLRAALQVFEDAFLPADPDGQPLTWVGCNPRFDVGFLWGKHIGVDPRLQRARRRLGLPAQPPPAEPWKHRLLDLETYAAGVLGIPNPPGLNALRARLVELGWHIPAPDHTAAGDVITTRACHRALLGIVGQRTRGGYYARGGVTAS